MAKYHDYKTQKNTEDGRNIVIRVDVGAYDQIERVAYLGGTLSGDDETDYLKNIKWARRKEKRRNYKHKPSEIDF